MTVETTSLEDFDGELHAAILAERRRQEEHVELIASENYASRRVLDVQGSVLTNKYAEGYPGKRYYGGCEHVDVAEQLAIDRATALFGAAYANVQPHSGSQANAAACYALLDPGDRILGMSLSHGGHLTHGAKVNFSGKHFDAAQYGVDPATGLVDYDEVQKLADEHQPKLVPPADVVTSTTHKTLRGPRGGIILARENAEITKKFNSLVFPGIQGGPLMHVIAAKAVALKEAMSDDFRTYQEKVVDNAKVMAGTFVERGYDIVSGGTDNHLMLLSLLGREITGKDADAALGRANITVNKNTVPNETRSPFVTSGLRLGTPAITTRGFGTAESRDLTHWICDILDNFGDESTIAHVRGQVLELCGRFPVYD